MSHEPEPASVVGPFAPGAMGLGTFQLDPDRYRAGADALFATLRRAATMGIALIDTAPMYGRGAAEELVGRFLREEGSASEVTVVTKAGIEWDLEGRMRRNARPEALERGVKSSLGRLGVDVIDVCLLHWPDPAVPMDEVAGALDALRREGLVRWIGLCNGTPELLDTWSRSAPVHCVEECYSVVDRGVEAGVLPWATARGVPLIAYGALARGLLGGRPLPAAGFSPPDARAGDPRYGPEVLAAATAARPALAALARRLGVEPLALALAWLLRRPATVIPLVGAHHPGQLDIAAQALALELGEPDLEELQATLARVLDLRARVGPAQP